MAWRVIQTQAYQQLSKCYARSKSLIPVNWIDDITPQRLIIAVPTAGFVSLLISPMRDFIQCRRIFYFFSSSDLTYPLTVFL
uniref:Uncharacterized protein n=1 Tax=Ascaris lumbricoides TaxID=6252 RepID=A0A0M3HUS7_ASCLU